MSIIVNYVVLAAGKSRRMQLDGSPIKNKVLIPINGIPIIVRIVTTLSKTDHDNIFIIVNNHSRTDIETTLSCWFIKDNIKYVTQINQLGTADCIKCLREAYPNLTGKLVIVCGDNPGIKLDSLIRISQLPMGLISTKISKPTGYGRVVRDHQINILEDINCTAEQKLITEINTGIYCLNAQVTFQYIDQIKIDQNKGEYFLTDIFSVFNQNNVNFEVVCIEDTIQFLGVNDQHDLKLVQSNTS